MYNTQVASQTEEVIEHFFSNPYMVESICGKLSSLEVIFLIFSGTESKKTERKRLCISSQP